MVLCPAAAAQALTTSSGGSRLRPTAITGPRILSIHERVRLAGGTASVVTELNRGTRVRVQLPAGRRATGAAPSVSGRSPTAQVSIAGSGS